MACDCFLFIVLFTIPTTVVLSIFIGVAGWGCPSSAKESRIIFASFAFRNNDPSSPSAADDATGSSVVHNACVGLFKVMVCPFTGIDPKKNIPPTLLRALGAVKYGASECICRIISDA